MTKFNKIVAGTLLGMALISATGCTKDSVNRVTGDTEIIETEDKNGVKEEEVIENEEGTTERVDDDIVDGVEKLGDKIEDGSEKVIDDVKDGTEKPAE